MSRRDYKIINNWRSRTIILNSIRLSSFIINVTNNQVVVPIVFGETDMLGHRAEAAGRRMRA